MYRFSVFFLSDYKPPLFKAKERRTKTTEAPSLFSFRIFILILDPDPNLDHQESLFSFLCSSLWQRGGMSKLKIARRCFQASNVNKRMCPICGHSLNTFCQGGEYYGLKLGWGNFLHFFLLLLVLSFVQACPPVLLVLNQPNYSNFTTAVLWFICFVNKTQKTSHWHHGSSN